MVFCLLVFYLVSIWLMPDFDVYLRSRARPGSWTIAPRQTGPVCSGEQLKLLLLEFLGRDWSVSWIDRVRGESLYSSD